MKAEISFDGITKVEGVDGNFYSINFWVDMCGKLSTVVIRRVEVKVNEFGQEFLWEREPIGEIKIGKE